MSTSLYDLTVPAFIRGLTNLSGILDKGLAHAKEQGVDPATLAAARLFEDMAPLTGQIQRASDSAKLCPARLAGIESPVMEDNEASFEDMQARIARTIDFLKTIPREAIDGKEDADIVLKFPNGQFDFKGRGYVLGFALPNFYFHVTTAYNILRHNGVPVGKKDFIGG